MKGGQELEEASPDPRNLGLLKDVDIGVCEETSQRGTPMIPQGIRCKKFDDGDTLDSSAMIAFHHTTMFLVTKDFFSYVSNDKFVHFLHYV